MKNLGWKIKNERIAQALSQGELAVKLGIKQEVLSRWETGKVIPSMKSIKKVADALGIDPRELTKRIQTMYKGVRQNGNK